MNLDRTFCSGFRCRRANSCHHWIEHLSAWVKANKVDMTDKKISIAQYGDHSGDCTQYVPTADEDKKGVHNRLTYPAGKYDPVLFRPIKPNEKA